ncbi:uncharacterized protein LOC118742976 [Rhagoletis pomonella]|uniref:uncharacterized protein LOC118742976 n=1 Tax=Rhagoletis pomonella TaxID=28610 RepID=UPI0017850BAF|nr:uncharacterized protein LOC118742976 [Rhagoletis pomonella]
MADADIFNESGNEIAGAAPNHNREDAGFTSCSTNLDIKGIKLTIRMLRMNAATMVFISHQGKESLNEMGIAFPAMGEGMIPSSTTLFGPEHGANSQRLADLWSKRYKRQFIVSCNVQTNDVDVPVVEKAVGDWIRANLMA